MKVGTDGVLLGAWAQPENASGILDVGTGTGLIAIMLAQRSAAMIDAVESDREACDQARENIAGCRWHNRIKLYHSTIQEFSKNGGFLYDLVVSNPPFFRNSLRSPVRSRSLARHGDQLSYEELLVSAALLLGKDGRMNVIIPANEQDHFTDLAYFHGLYPSRFLMIRPVPGKGYSRCLAEFVRNRLHPCTQNELTIKREDGPGYSDDYINLTSNYINYPAGK